MLNPKRRLKAAVAAAAVSLAVLSGCAGEEDTEADGKTTLLVWDQFTDPSTKAAAEKVYAAFEAANPDIQIETESYRYEDMGQLAKTALASGTGPDVLYFDAGQGEAGLLAESDLIMPLAEYDEQYGWSERLSPEILSWTTYSDQLYGLGLESEVAGLFANETLISQEGLSIPKTYDELLSFCGAAEAAGFIPVSYGQGPAILAKDAFALVANNILGPEAVSDLIFSTEGGFDSPEVVQALDIWFSEMVEAGCFPEGVNGLSVESSFQRFADGKAMLLAGGSFWSPELKDVMPDAQLSLLPFPSVEEGGDRFYPAGVGSAWIISAAVEDPDAAAKFLDFQFTDESVQTWMEMGGLVPPVEVDLGTLTLSPLELATAELIQRGEDSEGNGLGLYIWPVWSAELNSSFQDWAQAITDGQSSAEEVGAQIQTQWQEDKAEN